MGGTQRRVPSSEHGWTNEKHMHFLSSMEASFVRSMLEMENNINSCCCSSNYHVHDIVTPPPQRITISSRGDDDLDRYIPDICESTLDSMPQPPNNNYTHLHTSSDSIAVPPTTRRHNYPSRISNSSHRDQVVPNSLLVRMRKLPSDRSSEANDG